MPNGIEMRYVVANPSSYLYLDEYRPRWYGEGFGVPYASLAPWAWNPGFAGAPFCPASYDDWKFGLSELNGYAGAVGASTIRTRLKSRNVTVLLGTADTYQDGSMDTSCPARLQGPNRYERGHNLMDYLDARHPNHNHVLVEVDGAAHDARAMFVDGPPATGAAVLFTDW